MQWLVFGVGMASRDAHLSASCTAQGQPPLLPLSEKYQGAAHTSFPVWMGMHSPQGANKAECGQHANHADQRQPPPKGSGQ